MKHVGEEQQDAITTLNDGAVVDYLLQHPEFFIRNAAVVEQMRVPHPVRGMVSLVEWHMARSRNYIAMLEENMSQLMEQATANESLFYRLLHLQNRLACAESLDVSCCASTAGRASWGWRAHRCACSLTAGVLAPLPDIPIWCFPVRPLSRCAFNA